MSDEKYEYITTTLKTLLKTLNGFCRTRKCHECPIEAKCKVYMPAVIGDMTVALHNELEEDLK